MSWVIVSPIQCVTIHIMYSLWELHLDDQDQPSLQSRGSALQPQIDCLSQQTNYERIIYLWGTHDLDLLYKTKITLNK